MTPNRPRRRVLVRLSQWGALAAGRWLLLHRRRWLAGALPPGPVGRVLAWLGRWPLSVYMLHQPLHHHRTDAACGQQQPAFGGRKLPAGHHAPSKIATARVQPALAPRILCGKQLMQKPSAGSASRLCNFSMWPQTMSRPAPLASPAGAPLCSRAHPGAATTIAA